MSLWPRIPARPRPSVGRQRPAAHPSKPCRTTLDAPTHQLDKRPLHFTPWRSSKSSRPNSSSDADGDQGCGQGPLPGLTSLPHWPVRTRCGRVRGVLHCGTEVVPGNATLPAKSAPAPKLARVAPDLHWLPSLPRQRHRLPSQNPGLRLETDLVRLDAARLLSAKDPGPRLCWTWSMGQEEGGAKSRGCRTNPQAASVEPPSTPVSSGCRGQCVFRSHWAHTSAQTAYRSYSGYNKTQTFSKREQISSSTQHEWPVPTWRQTARSNPTPCHAGRGLAGHPRGVRLGYGDNKTRLLTTVRSKNRSSWSQGKSQVISLFVLPPWDDEFTLPH